MIDSVPPSSSSLSKKSFSSNKSTTLVDIGNEDDGGGGRTNEKPGMANWLRKLDLERQIAEIDADVFGIKNTIEHLNAQLTVKGVQREQLVMKLREVQQRGSGVTSTTKRADGIDKFKGIDYMDGEFDWVGGLKARMRSVFGINEFRLCQRGFVCVCSIFSYRDASFFLIQNLQCQYGRQGHRSRDAHRWWQITHVPASSPSHSWMYTRHITLDIPHHRPNSTSPKSRK